MFIHDAMNELVVCGETEVLAANIRLNISRMERLIVGEEAVSGFQKQFEVYACHEYGSEVWEGNKSQTAALESVMLGGAKRILGCSSKTCNEAVRGDIGLETLQGRRDKSKLKVWYKLASMSEDRYPRKVFSQDWDAKPHRGRQRKVWSRLVDNLFVSLNRVARRNRERG